MGQEYGLDYQIYYEPFSCALANLKRDGIPVEVCVTEVDHFDCDQILVTEAIKYPLPSLAVRAINTLRREPKNTEEDREFLVF